MLKLTQVGPSSKHLDEHLINTSPPPQLLIIVEKKISVGPNPNRNIRTADPNTRGTWRRERKSKRCSYEVNLKLLKSADWRDVLMEEGPQTASWTLLSVQDAVCGPIGKEQNGGKERKKWERKKRKEGEKGKRTKRERSKREGKGKTKEKGKGKRKRKRRGNRGE